MNKKYSYGNEFITDSFSLCNYEINLNNTNNRLNYLYSMFYPTSSTIDSLISLFLKLKIGGL